MEEEIIANTSYTNKDFRTIYPELLDLVAKISDKWNPNESNESDPGVILLKLNAIIGDKNNYNIDKNVLEFFPLSVSQYGNARKLYDTLGYSMKWYNSAITKLSFKWTGTLSESESITIPRFTMISNSDKDIVYTLMTDVTLPKDGTITSSTLGPVIQGTHQQYSINGETAITLSNLDSDFRLYFKERQIAENGIFISNIYTVTDGNGTKINYDFTEWSKVDNLEVTPLNTKVYSFDVLPNSNTCYIQFPQDMASLIEDGIVIHYVISDGVKGNVSAGELNTFYADITDDSNTNVTESIKIISNASALDGEDPENLDSAYTNYKRTVGTFNTLVTCKDYETAIYNLPNESNPYTYDNLVSNVVVSDRTNDINDSYYIKTKSEALEEEDVLMIRQNDGKDAMDAFTLGLYLLHPIGHVLDNNDYNGSFAPDRSNKGFIESNDYMKEYKSVQHDYKDIDDKDTYYFRNDFTINCKINTSYKVSETESKDILTNIRNALYRNFNARKVAFGEEVTYDDIVSVIQGADSRIKSVIMDEPDYTVNLITGNGTVKKLADASSSGIREDIITKSVLAGVTPLYNFDNRFNYEFGQSALTSGINDTVNIVNGITSISTSLSIGSDIKTGYKIKENESVYLVAPNYESIYEYSIGVKCDYTLNNDVPKNSYYKLSASESIKFTYTTNGEVKEDSYGENTIIKTSVQLQSGTNSITLSTTNKINIMDEVKTTTDKLKKIYCYWITNNVVVENNTRYYKLPVYENKQFVDYILKQGEYFLYTNSLDSGELVILGSGTKISVGNSAFSTDGIDEFLKVPTISITDVYDKGINSISSWKECVNSDDSSTYPSFVFTEMQLISLGEGATVKGKVDGAVDSIPRPITDGKYMGKEDSTFTDLPELFIDGATWQIFTDLMVVSAPNVPQKVGANQSVTFNYVNSRTAESHTKGVSSGQSFLLSYPTVINGGQNVDVARLTPAGEFVYDLDAYIFRQTNTYNRDEDGYYKITLPTRLPVPKISDDNVNNEEMILPILVKDLASNDAVVYGYLNTSELSTVQYNATDNWKYDYKLLNNLEANKQYELSYGETFEFYKLGSDGNQTDYIMYSMGDIIQPSFKISKSDYTQGISIPSSKNILASKPSIISKTIDTNGISYVTIPTNVSTIQITVSPGAIVYLGKISKRNGFMSNTIGGVGADKILDNISTLDTGNLFDWTYQPSEDEQILDPTNSDSFWNANHIFNRYTLPKFDTANSTIQIAKSSKA